MGTSLNGQELGNGISQRKDGLYQARFINRFGKRQTIYAKTLNEVRHQLRTEQYNDEKAINSLKCQKLQKTGNHSKRQNCKGRISKSCFCYKE